MRILTWLISNVVALAVTAWLLPGVNFDGPSSGLLELQEKAWPVLLVAIILGLVTSFVEPVVKIFSIPFIILTIGLFLIVINALMLLLTEWIAGGFDLGFHVDGFWWAVAGGIVIALVTSLSRAVLDDD